LWKRQGSEASDQRNEKTTGPPKRVGAGISNEIQ
jgi:hypothetical protein